MAMSLASGNAHLAAAATEAWDCAVGAWAAAVVASTTVDGRHWLKFTVLNPRTSIEDIAEVLDLIADHARDHLARPAVLAS